jgi:hypothetical protein
MPQPNNPFRSGTQLHTVAETLLARSTPPLVPNIPWKQEIARDIEQAAEAEKASVFVTAALHLLNDDLERAHRLVQAREGDQTADYLHMLVHRREGDWSNTGYWVRRAGEHPVYHTLSAMIQTYPADRDLLSSWNRWDPQAMVELCRQAATGEQNTETATAVSQLSTRELAAVLDWCVRDSGSGTASAT